MTPVDEWMTAPAPPADATTERLIKHDWQWHADDPDDECPACRVDRGIALLDERRPGWWEDVDVEAIEMRHPCQCVLGQTYRDFYAGVGLLFPDYDTPIEYGFDARNGLSWQETQSEYDVLATIWRRRISERRAQ